MAIFKSYLADTSGQPNLIIGSPRQHNLIWTLVNNDPEQKDLVITPFGNGKVGADQYHFMVEITPAAFTTPPQLDGWQILAQEKDGKGVLYLAYSGKDALKIQPGQPFQTTLKYENAAKKDANRSEARVTTTAGQNNVAIGGRPITPPAHIYGPGDLTLLPASALPQSVPPIAVDFVGRRTVLNDGHTPNSFTFAITNMTHADIALSPGPTLFTVSFDAAPNESVSLHPWALARVQHLNDDNVGLAALSTKWKPQKNRAALKAQPADTGETGKVAEPNLVPGNPQWSISVNENVVLQPQIPVLFTFSNIVTDLEPGIARMYLHYRNLPGFPPGVLIAELEKSPLSYGESRGQGLYVCAGMGPDTPASDPNHLHGLYVRQLNKDLAAAMFVGGRVEVAQGQLKVWNDIAASDLNVTGKTTTKALAVGIGVAPSVAKLEVRHPGSWQDNPPVLRFGSPDPLYSMDVCAKSYAGGQVSFLFDPISPANPTGKVALNISNSGNVGIGTDSIPGFPLSFPKAPGDKISLWGDSVTSHYGFGIRSNELQIHTDSSASHVSFGYGGGSTNFTETMRISGTGDVMANGKIAAKGSIEADGNIAAKGDVTAKGSISAGGDFIALGDPKTAGIFFATDTKYISDIANRSTVCNSINPTGGALMLVGNQSRTPRDGATDKRWVAVLGNLDVGSGLWLRGDMWIVSDTKWQKLTKNPTAPLSDSRLKRDVQSVPAALDKVRQLRGVTFRWNEEAKRHLTRDLDSEVCAGPVATEAQHRETVEKERRRRREELSVSNVGVLAQEVEAVLPEAVTTEVDGYKSVRCDKLVPLLIEAIKEQDRTIREQERRLARLEAAVRSLATALRAAGLQDVA
jgi:hypothetical protein